MINQEILDYVQTQLQAGYSKEQIQEALIAGGWQKSDIDQLLSAVNSASIGTQSSEATVASVSAVINDFSSVQTSNQSVAGTVATAQGVGFLTRCGASFIDSIVILVIGGTIAIFFGSALVKLIIGADFSFGLFGAFLSSIIGFILGLCVANTFNFLLEAITGSSIGKMILGLQVAQYDGSKAAWWQLLSRVMLVNVGFVSMVVASLFHIPIITTVGGVFQFFIALGFFLVVAPAHQTICDKATRTSVFYRREIFGSVSIVQMMTLLVVGLVLIAILTVGVIFSPKQSVTSQSQSSNTVNEVSTTTTATATTTALQVTTTPVEQATTSVPTQPSKTTQPVKSTPVPVTPSQTSVSANGTPVLISISPASGPVGTKMTITGKGFDSNKSYDVYYGNSEGNGYVKELQPSLSGQIGFTTSILGSPCPIASYLNGSIQGCGGNYYFKPGVNQVAVRINQVGETAPFSNPLTFTMSENKPQSTPLRSDSPILTSLSSYSGVAGNHITITGKGFDPKKQYTIYFGNNTGSEHLDAWNVHPSAAGQFDYEIPGVGFSCPLITLMNAVYGEQCKSESTVEFKPGTYYIVVQESNSPLAPFSTALTYTLTK